MEGPFRMPAPVGRKRLVFALFVLGALALAGAAWASNGGIGPESPVTPNGRRINHAYWFIFGFTAAIFVIVEGALIAFIWRYRAGGRPRTAEGLQLHGHTRLELIWTVVPVLIL